MNVILPGHHRVYSHTAAFVSAAGAVTSVTSTSQHSQGPAGLTVTHNSVPVQLTAKAEDGGLGPSHPYGPSFPSSAPQPRPQPPPLPASASAPRVSPTSATSPSSLHLNTAWRPPGSPASAASPDSAPPNAPPPPPAGHGVSPASHAAAEPASPSFQASSSPSDAVEHHLTPHPSRHQPHSHSISATSPFLLAPPSPQSPAVPVDGREGDGGRSSNSEELHSQGRDALSPTDDQLPSSSPHRRSSSASSLARQSSQGDEVEAVDAHYGAEREEGDEREEEGDGRRGVDRVDDGAGGAVESSPSSAVTSPAPASSFAPSLVRPQSMMSPSSHLHRDSLSRQLYLDEELVPDDGTSAAEEGEVQAAARDSVESDDAGGVRGGPGGGDGGGVVGRPRLHLTGGSAADEPSRSSFSSSQSSSGLPSPVHAERRVDVSDEVKLSSILSLQTRRLENRFLKDFVPVPPPHVHVDTLVAASLAQFSKPIVQVMRDSFPYRRYQPRKIRLLDYEVDEAVKAKARLDQAKDAAKKGTAKLQDLFRQPSTAEPAEATANGGGSTASPSKGHVDLDNGRYEELGSPDDLLDVALFAVSDDDAAAAIKKEQTGGAREGLFWRFSPEFEWSEQASAELQLVRRQAVAFWTSASHHAVHFLLSVQALRFSLGNVEPLYATLAIYDLKAETKCSEDFHFDLNDPSLLPPPSAQAEAPFIDPLTQCKHAVFSLTEGHTHEAVMLVLKVERVLQGDPAEMEVYLKTKAKTPQELAALAKKSRANYTHLADYRQPFAWGMAPLFDGSGELRTSKGGSLSMERLYFQSDCLKDDLFIAMAREALADGGRRLRPFPPGSSFECRLDRLDEQVMPANRMDPSYIPLKNTAAVAPVLPLAEMNVAADAAVGGSGGGGGGSHHRAASTASLQATSAAPPTVKEVLDYTTSTLPIPANGFVNLLYVYPESIRFDKFRNIACRVQIRSSDSHVDPGASTAQPSGSEVLLKVLMGRSSSTSFTTSALTAVNYHKKSVTPQDEVKVMLPLHLTPTFHLFFTFYKSDHTHTSLPASHCRPHPSPTLLLSLVHSRLRLTVHCCSPAG